MASLPMRVLRRTPGGLGADGGLRALRASRAGRALAVAVALLLLATLAGLVALWPGERPERPSTALGGPTLAAEVVAARAVPCGGPVAQRCRRIEVRLSEGPDAGRSATIDLGPLAVTPAVGSGDRVRVQPAETVPGAPAASLPSYGFQDVDRRAPMLWLAVTFGLLSVAVARLRGLLALIGLGLSLLLVVRFLVPAILDGAPALPVALVGSLAVMFVTLGLTYGVGAQSLAAALGIAASLVLATLLGGAAVELARLDGRTPDLQPLLVLGEQGLSLQGVVLAGMVVGVLGVLTDMAVSQASAVMALRRADPRLGAGALYRRAFVVGRDHLAATVHTLVLAYVGAALPLLLVLREAGVGATDALNGQLVAEPVVATLVGAIALLASVPLTTGLAAALVARVPVAALGDAHRGHAH